MSQYDFSTQEQLFSLSLKILKEYDIKEWSFGGGTALSALYYQHRMSYDIDIFSHDYSAINRLVENRDEIAKNLGIDNLLIESSPTAVTFILDTKNSGLKLDFVYSEPLTSNPYKTMDVFGFENIKVQTPLEIIAKKLKYREKATIRDFIDYAIVEEKSNLFTQLKSEDIVDIERYLDVVDKFNAFDKDTFNTSLKDLLPFDDVTKEDFSLTINGIMKPKGIVDVALDSTGEVVAFDEFIETYRPLYEEVGTYTVFKISNDCDSYKDILKLSKKEVLDNSNRLTLERYLENKIPNELERIESLSDDTKERIHAYGSLMEDKALMDAVRSTDSEDLAALGEYFQELSQNDYVDYDTFGNNQIQEMR